MDTSGSTGDTGTEVQDSQDVERVKALSTQPLESVGRQMPEAPGYQAVKWLGEGTYGQVWLAEEERSGVQVAIKFVVHGLGAQWESFRAEVQKLALLDADPGIVHLKDADPDANPPYYVMPYLEQGSLADRLQKGPLPLGEALSIFRQVAEALAYVHLKGIRHCDLKPGNVLLDARGRVRLADFGQACLSSSTNPALGTFFYMAPEQADLGHVVPDTRWDVYGLGAILYAMLTGHPPRKDPHLLGELEGTEELSHRLRRYRERIRSAPKPDGHRRVAGVDRALAELLDCCLEVDPGQRLRSAQAVLEALARRERRRRQRPLLVFGFLTTVLVALAVGGLSLWRKSDLLGESHEALTRQLYQSNLLTARMVANAIQEQLVERRDLLTEKADHGALRQAAARSDRPELRRLMQQFHDDHKQLRFDRWSITDGRGKTLANWPEDTNVLDKDFSWRDWFSGGGDKEERPDEPYPPVGRPYISQPYVGRSQGTKPTIALSAPVPDPDNPGRIAGVLLGTIKLADLHQWLEEVQIQDGFIVLLNERCHCLQHRAVERIRLEPGKNPRAWDCATYQDLLVHRQEGGKTYVDPVDAGTYVAGFAPLRKLGWGLLVQHERAALERDVAELQGRVNRHSWITMATFILLTAGVWGFLIWTLRREEGLTHG
jgi:serine/threonine protein kinase